MISSCSKFTRASLNHNVLLNPIKKSSINLLLGSTGWLLLSGCAGYTIKTNTMPTVAAPASFSVQSQPAKILIAGGMLLIVLSLTD